MSFRVAFRSTTPPAGPRDLVAWLTQVAEPAAEDADGVVLRALPARFTLQPFAVDVTLHEWTPLSRLVDVLFDVASQAGADLDLGGKVVNRSDLWLVLAEEQDRLRTATALRRAREHGNADEVHRRLWAVLASLRPGSDSRWDAHSERVVELLDVGEQVSVEQARELLEGAAMGDVVQQPVAGPIHILLWRWLSEVWPGLCEPDHSLH